MFLLKVEELTIEVTRKKIKNLHLKVYPPHGQVKVSAPLYMSKKTIEDFVNVKLSWIEKQQCKIESRVPPAYRDYLSGETHFFMGKAYSLSVLEINAKPSVELSGESLILKIRPGQEKDKRREILNQWYRQKLMEAIPSIIQRYEPLMKVKVREFRIKRMKTRWGTCHTKEHRIWINLELAKPPPLCLEYIVVHEMCHLIEKGHNHRFYTLMDQFFPEWKLYREKLRFL